ncbi:MAG: mechanosensitive ion channel family protein [Chlamydiales bacterium]|nr:mechanosensitive ion channel family protein [Chlamydiales bacterium]
MTPTELTQSPAYSSIWLIKIGIAILLLILLNYLLKRLIKSAHKRALSNSLDWRSRLDKIVLLPAHFMLWIIGAAYVINVAGEQFGIHFEYVTPTRNGALICCLSWILIRWKTEAQHALILKGRQENKTIDASMVHMVGRILSVTIIVLTAIVVLQVIGINVLPLIAFGGIGAAALGFAAKDVIANFFGGLMLYVTRPFFVGDLILLPDRSIEGYVEEIGWYLTSIRDKEKRPVYLPNAIFSTVLVVNSSRMSHRRIEEKIGVRYEDLSKIKSLVEEIRRVLVLHPMIDTGCPVMVFFDTFGDYFLNIYIDAYCKETRQEAFLAIKQEILLNICNTIDNSGAQMPFPTSAIHLTNPQ